MLKPGWMYCKKPVGSEQWAVRSSLTRLIFYIFRLRYQSSLYPRSARSNTIDIYVCEVDKCMPAQQAAAHYALPTAHCIMISFALPKMLLSRALHRMRQNRI